MSSALTFVFENLVIPFVAAWLGGRYAARQVRRTIHITDLSEEEAVAYKEALADFKTLRREAALKLQAYLRQESAGQMYLTEEEQEKARILQDQAVRANQRLRETAAIGSVDLSAGAIKVIRDYFTAWDDPNNSSGDGIFYDADYYTRRFLAEFQERRKVELGAMDPLHYHFRRGSHWIARHTRRWHLGWKRK